MIPKTVPEPARGSGQFLQLHEAAGNGLQVLGRFDAESRTKLAQEVFFLRHVC